MLEDREQPSRGSLGAGRFRPENAARRRVAPSRVTLARHAETWLPRQKSRLRPTTYRLYDDYLRLHVNPRLGRRRLQEITVAHIALLISEMQEGIRYTDDKPTRRQSGKAYAAWTIRGVLVVLRRLFLTAAREGIVTTNPIRQLEPSERPKTERRQLPSLDRAAIGRLIEHTPERYRTLVALSVLTGIRQGEALGLRWQDVDLEEGLIRITNQIDRKGNLVEPKTSAAKPNIPIAPSLTRLLTEAKETNCSQVRLRSAD